jgi:hypothetical protein
MTPTELRLQLLAAGFSPLPLIGKRPVIDGWQHTETNPDEIVLWEKLYTKATNTGVLTKFAPAFDIDIFDQEAAPAIEQLARDRFEEKGYFLVRFGQPPKRAILFRTDAPFAKTGAVLVPPNAEALAPEKREQKLEFLCNGQQLVVDGIHPDIHRPYSWHGGKPGEIKREDLPYLHEEEADALIADGVALLVNNFGYRLKSKPTRGKKPNRESEDAGPTDWSVDYSDHDQLAAHAMRLIRSGMNGGAAVNLLRTMVADLKDIDLARKQRRLNEIPGMVASAQEKLAPEPPLPEPPLPTDLDQVINAFDKWIDLPDKTPLYATLGAIVANLLDGDPVWLGIIAPSSSAKTELLNATSRLTYVAVAEAVTPAALLSGTPKRQQTKGATGGLLPQIGDFGILAFKDFGTVLDMRPEARGEMLSALRRVYDGEYVRQIGADGGRTLKWSGKAGLLFAATQKYDLYHGVIGTLGDRFLLVRLDPTSDKQFDACFRHVGKATKTMRAELAEAVAGLFASLPSPLPEPDPLNKAELAQLKETVLLAIRLPLASSATASNEISKPFMTPKVRRGWRCRWSACSRASSSSVSTARRPCRRSSRSRWTRLRASGSKPTKR